MGYSAEYQRVAVYTCTVYSTLVQWPHQRGQEGGATAWSGPVRTWCRLLSLVQSEARDGDSEPITASNGGRLEGPGAEDSVQCSLAKPLQFHHPNPAGLYSPASEIDSECTSADIRLWSENPVTSE